MKINPLINEFVKGLWMMHIPALEIYGVMAYRLFSGERIETVRSDEPKSILNFYTQSGRKVGSDENLPQGSVAVVDMIGPLIKYGDWCTYGADEITNALAVANNNPKVSGIILNVDGPGGSVSAVAPFQAFATQKKKPVVALYDQCCSAHLYAAYLVADYVMAANDISSMIGSIGVVLSWSDNKKYLESKGYEFHEVYPPESEHKNEAFRLASEGKYDLIKQEMLSPMAIKFQDYVKAARPNLKASEKGVLTGKVFLADDALRLGFADGIGSMNDAINTVLMLSEINRYK